MRFGLWKTTQTLLPAIAFFLLMVAQKAFSCEYSHLHPGHTMCVYGPRECPEKQLFRSGELSSAEKSAIVSLHNELRSSLARGEVPEQPPARNMREMSWDDELASIAQRWADHCGRGHDKHRNVDRFNVGQNVAVTWSLNREPPSGGEADFDRLVRAWFDEVRHFDPRHVSPFVFSKKLGHYTQMAWAETRLVGCGFSYFREEERGYTKMYVCNYGPQGNIIGDAMYRERRPGQKFCRGEDSLEESKQHPGLCRSKSDPAPHLEGPNLLRNITLRPPPLNAASDLKHHQTNIVKHHHGHHKHQHHGPKMMMSMAKKLMKRVMRFAKAFEPFNLFHNHG